MKGIRDYTRLLMNLLHHEMLVAGFLGSLGIPLNLHKLLLNLVTIKIVKGCLALSHAGHFHVADVVYVACVF